MYMLTIFSLVLIKSVILTDITYYEVLGVSKQATSQEVRQAYKKLAIKLHPDKNVDATDQEKFLKITEAYETLKDVEKRRQYDLYGSANSYTRKFDHQSQSEYNSLYYNGLYNKDPFVDTLSPKIYYTYLSEGFYFINFYSPFCPPCQNLVDHWKKLAEVYKGIVKVGAVNCKYHNSFCYNSMRISSYPSLIFYPNGKHGNFVYYRGDRTFESLEQFIMNYLKSQVHVPVISQIRKANNPIAYVLGENRIENNALIRIAHVLNGLVAVVKVLDEDLRLKLTKDESVVVVLKYQGKTKAITSVNEKDVLNDIVSAMPKVEPVDPETLKRIRSELRSGTEEPWVLYFTSANGDALLMHQLRIAFPHFNFGEINCNKWNELCVSLQAETTPSWAVLKRGGAYQRAPDNIDVRGFVKQAVLATRLHTLSASEFDRILNDDGTWVLLVAPYQSHWEHYIEPFTKTCANFVNSVNINFGIMACTQTTNSFCRRVTTREPLVLVINNTRRFYFSGRPEEDLLFDFITLIKESPIQFQFKGKAIFYPDIPTGTGVMQVALRETANLELSEQQILEIMDPSAREHTWLVAFLPAHCGEMCDDLLFEWLIVAKKLRPLEFVKLGVLRCMAKEAFCSNIRIPTGRLYPLSSGQHYTTNLQQLSQAPYIAEWALEHIDDSIEKLNWHKFSRNVISEDLHPTSERKPWLVYFHSPRCYRCYEMYPEFAIAGITLNKVVQLGKVNCLTERGICQNEHISSYPSLKLYLSRSPRNKLSSVVNIQIKTYEEIIQQVESEVNNYIVGSVGSWRVDNHISHDEF